MPEDRMGGMPPTARDAYEPKVRVPHKFCPYCGTRNPPDFDNCESCGKDISWIKVPEQTPHTVEPKVKRKPRPDEREKTVSRKTIVISLIVLLILIAVVLVIFLTMEPGKSAVLLPAALAYAGLVASPMRSTPNRQPLRALYQSHISSPTRRTSSW